jgi:hypothetical protein
MPHSDVDLSGLPPYVRERWPVAVDRAHRKAASAVPNPAAPQLVKAAQKASSATQRVVWLQRAASAWTQPLAPVAACRRGCAHCCHIPVTISSVEAEIIGRLVGVKPKRPEAALNLSAYASLEDALPAVGAMRRHDAVSPCPFLAEGSCSIYAARPMTCRLLLNLDDDDLLCRLVPGQKVPVPYANSHQLGSLYLMAQPAADLADIRDFFPESVAPRKPSHAACAVTTTDTADQPAV